VRAVFPHLSVALFLLLLNPLDGCTLESQTIRRVNWVSSYENLTGGKAFHNNNLTIATKYGYSVRLLMPSRRGGRMVM
ncbi:MAG: hypothetical protein KAI61_06415, partial [Alphaproteobacteria bacterium]|nr:hypothetical protein [Alphaproteobacteria bacterium]